MTFLYGYHFGCILIPLIQNIFKYNVKNEFKRAYQRDQNVILTE